jgi:hypothetical protein
MEQIELEPIDATRCQGEHRDGTFMTFGPRTFQRCSKKPTWVAIDFRDGAFYGAMSLCDDCKVICEGQIKTASFQKLLA